MNIRLATLDDIEAICLMYREFFAFNAKLQPAYYKVADAEDYAKNSIKSLDDDIIVAEIDGSIAGFVHVSESKTPPYDSVVQHKFAVCMDLFVHSSYRKRGVGTALICATKDWAKKRNLDYVELTVFYENESAVSLYEREGFQTVMHTMRCPV